MIILTTRRNNMKAYLLGLQSEIRVNPFKVGSIDWINWRKGWEDQMFINY